MGLPTGINKSKLRSMNPSTISIISTLYEEDRFLNANQIRDLTGYSMRTIRYSLKELQEKKLVKKSLSLEDMRVIRYKLILSALTSTTARKETDSIKTDAEKLKAEMQSHQSLNR